MPVSGYQIPGISILKLGRERLKRDRERDMEIMNGLLGKLGRHSSVLYRAKLMPSGGNKKSPSYYGGSSQSY
ncbi:hypothetical protein CJ030_MR1G014158 [Morella rubra]|uniref:Uncharacterized protein n=1 Tax=Morella rubra TaxID=262757 RepID=A0A6A1WMI9_9ROSI|nr:hypothetical protein CJ030_MR1G014158 [Morella rubra]